MLVRFIHDVVSILDRRYRESKIRTELEALTDDELSDIGLTRGDIHNVARQAARQY